MTALGVSRFMGPTLLEYRVFDCTKLYGKRPMRANRLRGQTCCFPKQQVCRKEDVAKLQLEPRYSAKKSMAYCAATMLPRASTDSSTL